MLHDLSSVDDLSMTMAVKVPRSSVTLITPTPPSSSKESLAYKEQQSGTVDSTWRPRLRVMPAKGWLNDPCGLGYDPVNRVYHLGFQWNPKDAEWGHICWGAARSRDLISWEVYDEPSISPQADYDCKGIFSGCMVPSHIDGSVDGTMTCIYTSVSNLPIHHTLPYVRGSETVALATSTNGGRTWTRHTGNPILLGPPAGLEVTGWRDPYVAAWPALDVFLQPTAGEKLSEGRQTKPNANLYAIISGGLRGQSPTVFLYKTNAHALDDWEYLGFLVHPGLNFAPSPRWTGDFGVNWEVCNFFTLSDPVTKISRDFIICGVEGRLTSEESIESRGEFRATHAQMWMSGRFNKTPTETGQALMRYDYGGVLDRGAFYAGTSFWDPPTRQQVLFGWVMEDDLSLVMRRAQGWAGMSSLPRVLRLQVLHGVVGALVSSLASIGSAELLPEDDRGYRHTVVTLCAIPDSRLKQLRGGRIDLLQHADGRQGGPFVFPQRFAQWEMQLSAVVDAGSGRVGFDIIHSPEHKTTVYLDAATETVVVDRSKSSSAAGIRRFTETAPHTLFAFADPRPGIPSLTRETLEFHIFYDNSVLEIFANERTALTTRVYPASGTSTAIQLFMERGPDSSRSELLSCELWPLSLRDRTNGSL